MKIWLGYSSEHSMNLVMIGRFKEERDAAEAKRMIDRITEQLAAEPIDYRRDAPAHEQRFGDRMLELLSNSHIYSVHPAELQQFGYEVDVELKKNEVVLTTEECDISAFLKILLDRGARVELYSAHEYPDTGYGR